MWPSKLLGNLNPRRVVESSESDDEDVEELIRKFSKALMKKIGKSSGKSSGKFSGKSSGKHGKEKDVPTCYRCNEPGHIKPDCPLEKKEKGNEKNVEASVDVYTSKHHRSFKDRYALHGTSFGN